MIKTGKFVLWLLCFVVFAALPCTDAFAAPRRAAAKPEPMGKSGDFELFMDGFFATHMSGWDIPGVVFGAVYKGNVIMLKGYGYANLNTSKKMDPENTIVRAASVSKAITAAAVMYQVGAGKMSLSDDINMYLRRWNLPEVKKYGAPVRLVDLLTHTAGFEERIAGGMTGTMPVDFAKALQKMAPERVFAPGEVYLYSNYGMSLAGVAVQTSSRKPFAEFVKARILGPLGMGRSGFQMDERAQKSAAVGHAGSNTPVSMDWFYEVPSFEFYTTAADMTRFITELLSVGGRRVLSEESRNMLLARHFPAARGVDGSALGFYENTSSGLRGLEQGGDIDGYSSLLYILPEKEFGFFYAANGDDTGLRDLIVGTILDRYWPSKGAVSVSMPTGRAPWQSGLGGLYRHVRHSYTTAEKGWLMFEPVTAVSVENDGVLKTIYEGEESFWLPVREDIFVENGGNRRLSFTRDEHGGVRAMTVGDVYQTFEPVPVLQSPMWSVISTSMFALSALLCVMCWIISALIRVNTKWYEKQSTAKMPWSGICLFWVMVWGFLAALNWYDFNLSWQISYGIPLWFYLLFSVPLMAIPVFLSAAVRAAKSLGEKPPMWEIAMFVMQICTGTWVYVFLYQWNLLGFRF